MEVWLITTKRLVVYLVTLYHSGVI